MKKKLEYDTTDINSGNDNNEKKEGNKKLTKKQKNILLTIAVIILIIVILLLGFFIKKNRVAAVLNDEAQNEMISNLSGYINQVAADSINKKQARQIAKKVVKDNFNDLLVENFMSLEQKNIQDMIDKSLHKYMQNYYTKKDIDKKIGDITNKFMSDLEALRKQIAGVKEYVERLNKDYEAYKKLTDSRVKELNSKIEREKSKILSKMKKDKKELESKIADINKRIDVKTIQTPLFSYIWNKSVQKAPSGKFNDKWNNANPNVKWHITAKEHDKSKMSIKEYVEILAKNDIQFTTSINKLNEYLNDAMDDEKKERMSADTNILDIFNTKVSEVNEHINQLNKKVDKLMEHPLWTGGQAEYNALGEKKKGTIYFVTE